MRGLPRKVEQDTADNWLDLDADGGLPRRLGLFHLVGLVDAEART